MSSAPQATEPHASASAKLLPVDERTANEYDIFNVEFSSQFGNLVFGDT